jgi:tetratricopeptide (TPR) repeat protein
MAKRPPQPKSKGQSVLDVRGGATKLASPSGPQTNASQLANAPPPPGRQRSSGYFEAVALYEKAVETLQRHDYKSALDQLESILRQYPDEKELQERIRLYLNVCERHVMSREASPQTIDERLYAATLAINGGKYDEAISHLRLVRDEDPDHDHALYMLAVAHAQRGEHAEAIAHLERAIAFNPENRARARRDPDLEPLQDDDAFRGALEAPPAVPRPERLIRRPIRPKTGR